MNSSNFINACLNKNVEHIPVWIMRQAGRYLKSYRDLRSQYSFSEMYKTPDLVTQVTLLPFKELNVDAAILFSDILTVPEAMGLELNFFEKQGPVFASTIRSSQDLEKLNYIDAANKMPFVYDGITQIKKELPANIPLIGFCGAPWTLATYMVEGKGSKEYENIKKLRYANIHLLDQLLDQITHVLIEYCIRQIKAGVDAIQIFDSWIGIVDEAFFIDYLKYIKKLTSALKEYNVPIIYFPKGGSQWLEYMSDLDIEVIGLDWTIGLGKAKNIVGNKFSLQGNLDPRTLTASLEDVRKYTLQMIDSYVRTNNGSINGYIGNLGHGIFPEANIDAAKIFIDTIHNYRV